MKQHQGEYMGSILSAWLESMGAAAAVRRGRLADPLSKETMDAGLNNAVKDNDSQFPPEWRLSRSRPSAPERPTDRGRSSPPPLSGLRVVDLSTWIAGAYCTRLLADGGAEVVKVEAPDGDPLRRWSASGAAIAPGDDGALFNYLAATKQSLVVDPSADGSMASLHQLLATADAVVWSRGSSVAEHPAMDPRAVARRTRT